MVDFSSPIGTAFTLLLAVVILAATWLVNLVFGRIILGAIWKRNRSVAYEVSSIGGILIWTGGVLLTLTALGASDTVVSVVVLLTGAFLIIATRDFDGNWFAGQTIKKIIPFKVGDWVKTSNSYGRVAKIDDLYTTLVTPQNESVVIPNSKLTSDYIIDRTTNEFVYVPVEVEIPATLELSMVSLTIGTIARELSSKFSDVEDKEEPEILLISQQTGTARIRVNLKVTNPSREEELKSEFRKRLASLQWPTISRTAS